MPAFNLTGDEAIDEMCRLAAERFKDLDIDQLKPDTQEAEEKRKEVIKTSESLLEKMTGYGVQPWHADAQHDTL